MQRTSGRGSPAGVRNLADIFLVAVLVAAGSLGTLSEAAWRPWPAHVYTGISSVVLLALVVFSGASMRRKFLSLHTAIRMHRVTSIAFILLAVLTYSLGYLSVARRPEALLLPHGLLAFAIVLLALFQVVPVHVLKHHPRLRLVHRVAGYMLLPLFLIQIGYGAWMALAGR